MSQVELNKTSIPVSVATLAGGVGIRFDPTDAEFLYRGLLASISTFLFDKKDKNVKTCIKVQDTKEPLLFAGIVEYFPEEDEEMPGNWSYVITTDEAQCDACQNNYDIADLSFNAVAISCTHRDGQMDFDDYIWLHKLFVVAGQALIGWLDENAKEGEVTELLCPGYFVASSGFEGKEKVISIVPDGMMKKIIKDDIAIEK